MAFCRDDHVKTLSSSIVPLAYQIVSFAWKLVQVSEGRQGERAVAAAGVRGDAVLGSNQDAGFFSSFKERSRAPSAPGHGRLLLSHLDAAPPCLTPGAKPHKVILPAPPACWRKHHDITATETG